MSSGREIRRPVTEQDVRDWERGWAEMMVNIWRENILRLGIVDTGRLHNTIGHRVVNVSGQITIAHEFMLYGIYVARGVGKGYRRGNSGKDDSNGLQFLGRSYRKAHKMGKAREKRDWFARKYLSSIFVLSAVERDLYGEAYMGTLSNVVQAMFGGKAVRSSKGTEITTTLSGF
ncbi:MAG: hypothetical protein ACTTKJ_06655 [Prevotella koreensis]|uniref:hypothetical protein n=1 Tax=Prevotella koreensis TaxID=2490854 RepID=UPI003FA0C932